jgi:hypothetical protein
VALTSELYCCVFIVLWEAAQCEWVVPPALWDPCLDPELWSYHVSSMLGVLSQFFGMGF